jgi:hypothetical protein
MPVYPGALNIHPPIVAPGWLAGLLGGVAVGDLGVSVAV